MPKPIHFRRCHVCGRTTHRQGVLVKRCDHCHKSLAPFYYFDDRFTATQAEGTLRPKLVEGELRPIQGLTVFWDG